jgi:hypothetical protein
MSPNLEARWTTWSAVSSGFREIEIGWDRLESVGLLAPFLAQSRQAITPTWAAWPLTRTGSGRGYAVRSEGP